ncbi:Mediator of RNA polymerase II transcription subunit 11 [Rhynchospora pubera]|uniref:Mediator of RNA polymerase II transcription subunit 11 n=1 Tax=Rhynchospora pubera TaxID=906938 RepID=A0AAV8CQ78_9POAL|nr:Mediator of RNA polymerase II transcription subunit 11 [Rhynchospora pubera]
MIGKPVQPLLTRARERRELSTSEDLRRSGFLRPPDLLSFFLRGSLSLSTPSLVNLNFLSSGLTPLILIRYLFFWGLIERLIGGVPRSSENSKESSSLQRLHYVEKRIVRLLELAGVAMDELGNASAPKTEVLASHCRDFMMAIKEIQTMLREEIRSTCEYRPFEKCDYNSRISNEICCKKLEHIIEQLDAMQQNIDQCSNSI